MVFGLCHSGLDVAEEIQRQLSALQEVTRQLAACGDIGTDIGIRDQLMLSYEDLARRDRELQPMFLDIACMLRGTERQVAQWIFEGTCKGSARMALQNLIDLSLVDCDPQGNLQMHDTLADMALYIISQPGFSPVYELRCRGLLGTAACEQTRVNSLIINIPGFFDGGLMFCVHASQQASVEWVSRNYSCINGKGVVHFADEKGRHAPASGLCP